MSLEVWPTTDDFVAEVGDVDLAAPLTDDDFQAILVAYHRYAVLVFPDQRLSQQQHVAFASRFGDIDHSMQKSMDVDDERLPSAIADVSNLDQDGNVMTADNRMVGFQRGNRLWHTDSSFKETPANASCLYMPTIPPVGGQTEFADMRAAYEALPDDLATAIEGQIALHSIATSRAKLGFSMTEEENQSYPRVPQVMVRTHRATGRRSIYVASHAGEVLGLSPEEGAGLIERLTEHATQRQFVYSHRWRPNDLVVWDNRCVLHRGRPFDDLRWPRDAQRATALDIGPTPQQEGIAVDAAMGQLSRR